MSITTDLLFAGANVKARTLSHRSERLEASVKAEEDFDRELDMALGTWQGEGGC